MCMCMCIYIYIYIYTPNIYIYIYTSREREREKNNYERQEGLQNIADACFNVEEELRSCPVGATRCRPRSFCTEIQESMRGGEIPRV